MTHEIKGDNRILAIRLGGDSPVDEKMRKLFRLFILEAVEKLQANGPVTRKALAAELGMDRNRVVRLAKALGVEGVFQ
jgi:hypothetical protein